MKAVVVHAPRDLRIDEVPEPQADPGQVVVRIAYGGICGSDLHYYTDARNGNYVVETPLVLGHEVVGIIDAIGADADTPLSVGDHVAIHPARPTPPPGGVEGLGLHLAPGGSYLGSASTTPHTQGGFIARLAVQPEQLRLIPADVPLRRAALAEPLAVALHGVGRAGDVRGKDVVVFGAGPIGCLAVAVLRRRGAATITAVDLRERPLEAARAVGADRTVQLGVDADLAPNSADVAIEASGSSRALSGAIQATRPSGTIVQLGILPAGDLPITFAPVVAKELAVFGSQRFDVELDESVQMIAETPALDAIVTHEFALEDAVQAFETALDSSASLKVLLAIDPDAS